MHRSIIRPGRRLSSRSDGGNTWSASRRRYLEHLRNLPVLLVRSLFVRLCRRCRHSAARTTICPTTKAPTTSPAISPPPVSSTACVLGVCAVEFTGCVSVGDCIVLSREVVDAGDWGETTALEGVEAWVGSAEEGPDVANAVVWTVGDSEEEGVEGTIELEDEREEESDATTDDTPELDDADVNADEVLELISALGTSTAR